jgi:hypothetical protein
MGRTAKALLVTAAAAAGAVAVKRAAPVRQDPRRHAVTVNRPPDRIRRDGRLPNPLTVLGDGIEVEIRPAPGNRGTEIYAKSRGEVGEGAVRRALRDTRSLLEAGDVLLPDGPPTTRPTLWNKGLRAVTRRGREGGLL